MKAVGLMSGTSADGVDAAFVEIGERSSTIKLRLIAFLTRAYPKALRKNILAASEPDGGCASGIAELNVKIGEVFSKAAMDVCRKAGIESSRLDFIGSHGQTVAHIPARGATLQIGEPAVIAARTGAPVVADFRPADLARGGQGAPLTPMADYHFFRHPKKTRVVVNIGGITNITVLKRGIENIDDIIGFDTGFGNMVLDGMAQIITSGKMGYDRGGRLASQGNVNDKWLKKILDHPFFRKKPPKSAGREEFGAAYLDKLQKQLVGAGFKPAHDAKLDLLATLTAAVAISTKRAIDKFALQIEDVDEVLLCGGGARNPALVEQFVKCSKPAKLKFTDDFAIPADAREAMAFALLGYLTMKRRPGNVPSVTGADAPVILGKVIMP